MKKQKKPINIFNKNALEKLYIPLILALLFFFLAVQGLDKKGHTTDEPFHTVRGVMLLKTGDFRINSHHPVLFNAISALPMVLDPDFKAPSTALEIWKVADKDKLAEEMVKINGGEEGFVKFLNKSRILMAAISSFFIVAFYFIVRREFGFKVSLLSTVLLATSPSFLTHGSLVTTDAPAMFTIFFATYGLYLYLKSPTRRSLIIFIVLAAIALLTKYTTITLAPVWLLIILIFQLRVSYKAKKEERKVKKFIKSLWKPFKIGITIVASWILLMTAAYGFQFKTVLESYYNNPDKLSNRYNNINDLGVMSGQKVKNVALFLFEDVKFPFPQYVLGFTENVFLHNLFGHTAFLMGEFHDKGWWYYFPVSFAIKEQASVVILTIISLIALTTFLYKALSQKKLKLITPEIVFAISPAVVLFFAMNSSINLGLRHILPILPFLFILIGTVINSFIKNNKQFFAISSAILLINLWSLSSVFPFYLEYFNEFIGGPKNGYMYLDDSNLDWGQNSLLIAQKVEEYDRSNKTISQNIDKLQEGGYLIAEMKDLKFKNWRVECNSEDLLIKQYAAGNLKLIERINFTHAIVLLPSNFWEYQGDYCIFK